MLTFKNYPFFSKNIPKIETNTKNGASISILHQLLQNK